MFDLEDDDGPWEYLGIAPYRIHAVRRSDGLTGVMLIDESTDEVHIVSTEIAREMMKAILTALAEISES